MALFLFFTAFTMYGVPHQALGAELSQDHHERSRIFGARHISFTLGMTGAFAFMHVASNASDTRSAVKMSDDDVALGADRRPRTFAGLTPSSR